MKFFVLAIGLVAVGCFDPKTTKYQYMPDMADNPTVKAQESFIDPPDHSVATNAILYPSSVAVAEKEFRNPFPKNEANLNEGKELYQTFCAVCHGDDGVGQGYLGESYPTTPPSLLTDQNKERKDGFFFMQITKGGALMPGYGHATTPKERWLIVHHLRQLQNQ